MFRINQFLNKPNGAEPEMNDRVEVHGGMVGFVSNIWPNGNVTVSLGTMEVRDLVAEGDPPNVAFQPVYEDLEETVSGNNEEVEAGIILEEIAPEMNGLEEESEDDTKEEDDDNEDEDVDNKDDNEEESHEVELVDKHADPISLSEAQHLVAIIEAKKTAKDLQICLRPIHGKELTGIIRQIQERVERNQTQKKQETCLIHSLICFLLLSLYTSSYVRCISQVSTLQCRHKLLTTTLPCID